MSTTLKPLTGAGRIATAKGETDLSPEKVLAYRERWAAQGYELPPLTNNGQTWTTLPEHKSSVGAKLHAVIVRETGHKVPCEACENEINALSLMTVEEAKGERERVVNGIYSRAWGHASWQDKIKLLADKALSVSTAGKFNVGKDIIGGWFDEAIEAGALPVVQKKKRGGIVDRGVRLRQGDVGGVPVPNRSDRIPGGVASRTRNRNSVWGRSYQRSGILHITFGPRPCLTAGSGISRN
jgi:hypothetical protein